MSEKKLTVEENINIVREDVNIVAEFRIIAPVERNQMLLEEYNNCTLCGSEMIFTHVTQFAYLQVEEDAFCPHCNISTLTETHTLQ